MEDNLYPRSTEYFVPNADMDEQREKAKEDVRILRQERSELENIINSI